MADWKMALKGNSQYNCLGASNNSMNLNITLNIKLNQ